jgi:hypothetical protein
MYSKEAAGQSAFKMQIEGMWALVWAMGMVNNMNFGQECDDHFVLMLPNLKQSQSSAAFRAQADPRSLQHVISALDLAYCLHWGIREAELVGQQLPRNLKPVIVVERRRAFEWLLSKDEWDEVQLDT